jgi:membrane-associated protein
VLDSLVGWISGSSLSYLLIGGIAGLDAVFPVVPGETAVITGAVLAAQGRLDVALVLVAAAIGSFAGDNVSYLLGRLLGKRPARVVLRGARGRKRLEWAREQLHRRGRTIVVIARFIPGGRTATTLSSGMLAMSWRRFGPADAVGASLWAGYATALGYLGGAAFAHGLWKPLVVSLGIAGVVGLVVEGYRRLRRRHGGSGHDGLERSGADPGR